VHVIPPLRDLFFESVRRGIVRCGSLAVKQLLSSLCSRVVNKYPCHGG
jgi:hypothetical protein